MMTFQLFDAFHVLAAEQATAAGNDSSMLFVLVQHLAAGVLFSILGLLVFGGGKAVAGQ